MNFISKDKGINKGQRAVFGQQNSRVSGWQRDFSAQEMNYDSDLDVSNTHLHSSYGERLAIELSRNLGVTLIQIIFKAKGNWGHLGLLLRLWAPFIPLCTMGAVGTGHVFSPLLSFIKYPFLEGIAPFMQLDGNFWCQLCCWMIEGICTHAASWHQHTQCYLHVFIGWCSAGYFCHNVTTLTWTKPGVSTFSIE